MPGNDHFEFDLYSFNSSRILSTQPRNRVCLPTVVKGEEPQTFSSQIFHALPLCFVRMLRFLDTVVVMQTEERCLNVPIEYTFLWAFFKIETWVT